MKCLASKTKSINFLATAFCQEIGRLCFDADVSEKKMCSALESSDS